MEFRVQTAGVLPSSRRLAVTENHCCIVSAWQCGQVKAVSAIDGCTILVVACFPSNLLHKALDHLLHARLLEVHRELGAFDVRDAAVAELVVEDALAEGEAAGG